MFHFDYDIRNTDIKINCFADSVTAVLADVKAGLVGS